MFQSDGKYSCYFIYIPITYMTNQLFLWTRNKFAHRQLLPIKVVSSDQFIVKLQMFVFLTLSSTNMLHIQVS